MHAVYVCTVHQNVKHMIPSGKLYDMTENQVKTYNDCLSKINCIVPSCYQGDCVQGLRTQSKILNRDLETMT
jgi:hypothetical protein